MTSCSVCRGFGYLTDAGGRKTFPCTCNTLHREMKEAGIPSRLYDTPVATKELRSLWIHGTGTRAKDLKLVGYLKLAIRQGKRVKYVDCGGLRQARVEAIGGELQKPGSELLCEDFGVLALAEIDLVKNDGIWAPFFEAFVKHAYNNDTVLLVSSRGPIASVSKHYGDATDVISRLVTAVGKNVFQTGGGA